MEEIEYPPLFHAADTVSLSGQQRHKRILVGDLVMIIAAAAMSVVALVSHETLRLIAVVSVAVTSVAGIAIKRFSARSREDRLWFNGRAVAETVKSLAWRYAMRVPPFENDANADTVFDEAIDDVSRETPGVQALHRSGWDQITSGMRSVRALDIASRRDYYIRERLDDQARWYLRKSAQNQRLARRWSRVTLFSQWGAVATAGLTIVFWEGWMAVIGLLATLATSAAAWSNFCQHDLLTRTYSLAASELEQIVRLARIAETEEELSEVVRNGEGSISREHTMWTAKRHD